MTSSTTSNMLCDKLCLMILKFEGEASQHLGSKWFGHIFSVDELGLNFISHLFLLGLESKSKKHNRYFLMKLSPIFVAIAHTTAHKIDKQ